MMGNFFNRMYYGKGNRDYTKDDLPDNRWQLFFAMLRLNFGKLVSLNLLFLLFFIPTYFWVIYLNMQPILDYLNQGNTELAQQLLVQTIYGMVPCFLILGPGIAGMTYITRNMAKDQNVWVWNDFWFAVKENWKQMLAVSLLNGVFLILAYIGVVFYNQAAATSVFFMLPQMLVIVMFLLWCMMNLYIWPMMVTYELKLRALIKNSAMIAIGRLPQTLFMAILALIPVAVLLLSTSAYVYLAILALYILIGFSLTSMMVTSVTNGIFDKYINYRIKGARVNQGLRVEFEDKEDEEEGPDDGNDIGAGGDKEKA